MQADETGWQSISSAPRDGTPFLTFTPDDTFSAITGIEVMWFDSQLGLVYGPDCSEPVFKPTHWRPLPAPPLSASPLPSGVGGSSRDSQATCAPHGSLPVRAPGAGVAE